jgi:hypothetical protein
MTSSTNPRLDAANTEKLARLPASGDIQLPTSQLGHSAGVARKKATSENKTRPAEGRVIPSSEDGGCDGIAFAPVLAP